MIEAQAAVGQRSSGIVTGRAGGGIDRGTPVCGVVGDGAVWLPAEGARAPGACASSSFKSASARRAVSAEGSPICETI